MNNQEQLDFGTILRNGIGIGLKNAPQLIVNFILFILTFWIPYLNVGTFIGISSGLSLKMSQGKKIGFTDIFDGRYRDYFGEYFLQVGLKGIAVNLAFAFMLIPGIILSISWMLSEMLFLDGKSNPGVEALRDSNDYTKAHRWAIFLAHVGLFVGVGVSAGVLGQISEALAGIFTFFAILCLVPVLFGMRAYIYRELVLKQEENQTDDVEKLDLDEF